MVIITIDDEEEETIYQVLSVSLQPRDDMNCLFWVFHLGKKT